MATVVENPATGKFEVFSSNGIKVGEFNDRQSAWRKKGQMEYYGRQQMAAGKFPKSGEEGAVIGEEIKRGRPKKEDKVKPEPEKWGSWKSASNPRQQSYKDSWSKPGSKITPGVMKNLSPIVGLPKEITDELTRGPAQLPENPAGVPVTPSPVSGEGSSRILPAPIFPVIDIKTKEEEEGVSQENMGDKDMKKENIKEEDEKIEKTEQEKGQKEELPGDMVDEETPGKYKLKDEVTLFRDGNWFFEDLKLNWNVTREWRLKVLENIKKNVRGQKIPIVDKHSTDNPTYGWVYDVYENAEKTALMFKPQYNKRGKDILEDGQFGYSSPNIDFNYYDPETKKRYGPVVKEITLTNGPRIKNSSAILAGFSEEFKGGDFKEDFKESPSGEFKSDINKKGGINNMGKLAKINKALSDLHSLLESNKDMLSPEAQVDPEVEAFKEGVGLLTDMLSSFSAKSEGEEEGEVPEEVADIIEEPAGAEVPEMATEVIEASEEITIPQTIKKILSAPKKAAMSAMVAPKLIIPDSKSSVLKASEESEGGKKEMPNENENENYVGLKTEVEDLKLSYNQMAQALLLAEQQNILMQEAIVVKEDNLMLSEMADNGKILPKDIPTQIEFLKELRKIDRETEENTLCLSENVKKTGGMEKFYKTKILSQFPTAVEFSEKGSGTVPVDVDPAMKLAAEALALSEKTGMSLKNATIKLSDEKYNIKFYKD